MKIRMGVGLGIGNVLDRPDELGAFVDLLEELRFDSLWVSDRATRDALDPFAALAFAAGRTERLKFGTNVLVLPGRDPRAVARQFSSVDRISGGRMLPAVGLGRPSRSDRPPFAVPEGQRVPQFEEGLAVLREEWAGTRPLEVWFGSKSEAALERTGRLSDGWIGSFQTPAETGAAVRTIIAAADAAGRHIDDDHYGTTVTYARERRSELAETIVSTLAEGDYVPEQLLPLGAGELVDVLRAHIAEGLSKFVLVPGDTVTDWRAELTWLREVTGPLQT